ncbi:hypothetical protein GM182_07715 [bacterium 3DAC]|nr:hypothetical protein GM182_07715 [bacterium 3DAC]
MKKLTVFVVALAMMFTSFVVMPFAPAAYAANDVSVTAAYTINDLAPSSLPTTDALRGATVSMTATFTIDTATDIEIPVTVSLVTDLGVVASTDATVTFTSSASTATASFTFTGVDTREGASDLGAFGSYLKVVVAGSAADYVVNYSEVVWTADKVTITGFQSSYDFEQNVTLQGSVKDAAGQALTGSLAIVHLGTVRAPEFDQEATTNVVSGLYVYADFGFNKTGYYEAIFADDPTKIAEGYYSVGARSFVDAKFELLSPTGDLEQGASYVFKAKYYSVQDPYTLPEGPLYLYDQNGNLIDTIAEQDVTDAAGVTVAYYAKVITVDPGVTSITVVSPGPTATPANTFYSTDLTSFTVKPKDASYSIDRTELPGFVDAPTTTVITDQDITFSVKDVSGNALTGTLTYTVQYYNNGVVQSDKTENGELAISSGAGVLTIPASKLADLGEGNDYVTITGSFVDSNGYIYKGFSFKLPVLIIKGVVLTSDLGDSVSVGTTTFNFNLMKKDGLATGTFTLYYALLKAPEGTTGMPIVPEGVTDVKAWLKEYGTKVVSATTPEVSIPASFNAIQAGDLEVVAYVILTDENETSEAYETFSTFVSGFNVENLGTKTATYGEPVTIKIKVTKTDGTPINNAKVVLYVSDPTVNIVPDVFAKKASISDYQKIDINGQVTNILGGIYDFNAVWGNVVDFTAKKAITVYAEVYDSNGDRKAVDVPVVKINPANDITVKENGEIIPGVESNFSIDVSGVPSGVTYSFVIEGPDGSITASAAGLTVTSYPFTAAVLGYGTYKVTVTTDDGNHVGYTTFEVKPVDVTANKDTLTAGLKYTLTGSLTYNGDAYTGAIYELKGYYADGTSTVIDDTSAADADNVYSFSSVAISPDYTKLVLVVRRNGVEVAEKEFAVGPISIKVKDINGDYVDAGSDVIVGYAGAKFTFEGKVAEADGTPIAGAVVTVKVAGVTSAVISTDNEGKFAVVLKPMAVSYIDFSIARDDFIAPFEKEVAVAMDREAPTIQITEPADISKPIQTQEGSIKIAGTVSDNVGVDRIIVIVNGVPAKVVVPVAGYFSTVVDLEPGTNTIVLKAYDLNGNEAQSDVITVEYTEPVDDQAPTINITAPVIPEGMVVYETDQPVVVVKGTVSDEGTGVKAVYVNGEQVDLIGDTFAKKVELTQGSNEIEIVAIDYAGNIAKTSITVVYDPYLNKLVIELAPGSQFYKVNGETKVMDVAPFINDAGRTMVPVRFIAEAMGLAVQWNAEKRQVVITGEQTEVILTIDSCIAMVDGTPVKMDSKAVIVDGRTFVPLRFVAEAFGFEVQWNAPVITLIKQK